MEKIMSRIKHALSYLILFSFSLLIASFFLDLGIREIPKEKSIEKYAKESDGSKFVQINGKTVHYRDQGQGPVLIAIHGFGDSLHSWEIIAEGLKKDFRIIRFDIPGNGIRRLSRARGIDPPPLKILNGCLVLNCLKKSPQKVHHACQTIP